MRFGWVPWKKIIAVKKSVGACCSFSWASEQSWLFGVNGCVGVYAFMFLNECDWMRDWLFVSEWVWARERQTAAVWQAAATGSSWADSPVTQIQSRPSAPTTRKSLVFIQRGSEKETETKVEGSFHERQWKRRKTQIVIHFIDHHSCCPVKTFNRNRKILGISK